MFVCLFLILLFFPVGFLDGLDSDGSLPYSSIIAFDRVSWRGVCDIAFMNFAEPFYINFSLTNLWQIVGLAQLFVWEVTCDFNCIIFLH